MKRFLSLALCVILLLTTLSSVGASIRKEPVLGEIGNMEDVRESPSVSDYFAKSNTRGEDDPLRWIYYPDYGILEITGTGAMPNFSVFGDSLPWDEFRDYIYGVYIDDNVTYIGAYAFYDCEYIYEIYLGESLAEIGNSAFASCNRLGEVEFPSGLVTIGECSFGSSPLGHLVIPDTVENIGRSAFENCDNMETLYIGAGVKSMGKDAFASCGKLRSVEIAEGVTELPPCAFTLCPNLREVILPESLTTLGYDTFGHMDSLQIIRIPGQVEDLPVELFWDTPLVCITLPAGLKGIYACAFEDIETLDHIFFCGTEEQWNAVEISKSANEALFNATIHYESDEDISIRYTKDMKKFIHCNICDKDIGESDIYSIFDDVSYEEYFFGPVAWAADAGITTGTTPDTFSPEKVCTRAQIVTFLWRANGCPMPETTECSFIDVSPKAYYYLPVLWAVEQGITNGVNSREFKPDSPCTRAQVATFLWRSEGSPITSTVTSPFSDIAKNSYYETAVLWAVEKGITNGTGATAFSPDSECTRGQIVTFLFRTAHQN